jgi:2'-5' RNA ligase
MPRLFVAIDLPDDVKDDLSAMMGSVPGAKWISRPQLHLTLRFIGEVDNPTFRAIRGTLETVECDSFDLMLKGVGQFPPKGKPRVLWVGVDRQPALKTLAETIETALEETGLQPEDRPFSAHITLARLKTPPPRDSVDRFMEKHARFQTNLIPVTRFILFSSILSPQGPRYTAEQFYPLAEA